LKNSIELAKSIRINSLKMLSKAKASHIGSVLSCADLIAVLYASVLKHDSSGKDFLLRDRFIFSKGHACAAVYVALAECGYFDLDELSSFGSPGSKLMSHISHHVNGVEFSTGALGHGLPFAVGKALFARSSGQIWRTYVLLSDGELNEGSTWEALMFAAHHQLENLIILVDSNGLQGLGPVSTVIRMEPLEKRFEAFGSSVVRIDGHDHNAILSALSTVAPKHPLVLIANTVKGKGVSFMENENIWHYRSPDDIELAAALKELEN